MTKRYAALLAVAVLFIAGDALACRSFVGSPDANTDTTTYKEDLNVDLADYGVIYEEAAPWSGCTQAAADALYKKLYTTFNPGVVGKTAWPHESDQIEDPFGPFQGWLGGGDAALIQATALRLANVGKLSKPLDDLVQRVSNSYVFNLDQNCGFSGTLPGSSTLRWTQQNSCMEDYTIGAMGLAWTAAYRAKRGLGNSSTPANAARAAITSALSVDSSICAWNQNDTNVNPAPARGPCTQSMNDLLTSSDVLPISLHGGDSMPYGVGLFTSLGGAAVGLEVATNQAVVLDETEQDVVQKLYQHARNYVASNHTSFDTDCWRFTLESGALKAYQNHQCGDANTAYHPKMFPIWDFVDTYAPPAATTAPGYDAWDPTLFCDTANGTGNFGACWFYNPGRRAVYGGFGRDWVQNPPIFTNTGLGDYTVTLRTYNGNYLSAASGGGGAVNATPTSAGSYEQFSLMNRTDSTLSHGDTVTLQTMTSNNAQWFVAEDGGGTGSVLNANRLYPWSWETFTILKLNGTGNINSGDTVALQSIGGYYVSATNGGGSTVLVDKTAAITWEAFTINLTHN
jgi:hypothetical protein